jgi:hypothetical protein
MNQKSNRFLKFMAAGFVATSMIAAVGSPALASTVSARGPKGQTISISRPVVFNDGDKVVVTGKGFDTKLGIYVTYCVIPPKGQRPDLCGPFDITGQNNASTWVSSNPPIYAKLLVKPFAKGGSFKVPLTITRMIGDQDCAVVACAITTRADHTAGSDRSADAFIPVKIRGANLAPSPVASATPAQ